MNRASSILGILASVLLTACAGMTVTPVNSDADDGTALGVRYYGNSPYLLVRTDSDGGVVAELEYLPDRAKKMSARPYNYLASNATTLQFTNGVLASSSVEADSTVVPATILGVLKDLAIAAVKAGSGAGLSGDPREAPKAPLPVLFKIVTDESGVHLWGPDGVVTGPVPPPQPTPPQPTGIHINRPKE